MDLLPGRSWTVSTQPGYQCRAMDADRTSNAANPWEFSATDRGVDGLAIDAQ